MEGAQFRDSRMAWFALALGVAALSVAALAPVANAGSPSQDQYGQPLPGVGSSGGGSTSGSSPSGTGETTIPVAPSGSDTASTPTPTTATSDGSTAATGGHSNTAGQHAQDKSSRKSDAGSSSPGTKGNGIDAANTVGDNSSAQSVPHIAADSAGDSWVPFFIAALVALGAACAVLVVRSRRRAA
jgi:hypothetical protein